MDSQKFYAQLAAAKTASKSLATASTAQKNNALHEVAAAIEAQAAQIVAANESDLARAQSDGMAESLQDRLRLTPERVQALADAVREIVALKDPIGEVLGGGTLANGMLLTKVRVPFGVIGAIYEARPNVTADIAALALKSGNAAVLRGGSAAQASNEALVAAIQSGLTRAGIDPAAVISIDEFGREGAKELMRAREYIDVLVPRGSANLIATIVDEAKVPVIETGAGVVHIYIDQSANLQSVPAIVENAKVQRPGVCNAVDTLLVHEKVKHEVVTAVCDRLAPLGVQFWGCAEAQAVDPRIQPASADTWSTEHLSLNLGIKVVPDLDAALAHIDAYSTKHTEAILADNVTAVERFLQEVDAASVISNASTRFTDGSVFGMGAEVGISTQKLHARGPMGITELTSIKWITRGTGQVRA